MKRAEHEVVTGVDVEDVQTSLIEREKNALYLIGNGFDRKRKERKAQCEESVGEKVAQRSSFASIFKSRTFRFVAGKRESSSSSSPHLLVLILHSTIGLNPIFLKI